MRINNLCFLSQRGGKTSRVLPRLSSDIIWSQIQCWGDHHASIRGKQRQGANALQLVTQPIKTENQHLKASEGSSLYRGGHGCHRWQNAAISLAVSSAFRGAFRTTRFICSTVLLPTFLSGLYGGEDDRSQNGEALRVRRVLRIMLHKRSHFKKGHLQVSESIETVCLL